MVPAFFCVRLHVGVDGDGGRIPHPFNFLETILHVGCEIVSKKLK